MDWNDILVEILKSSVPEGSETSELLDAYKEYGRTLKRMLPEISGQDYLTKPNSDDQIQSPVSMLKERSEQDAAVSALVTKIGIEESKYLIAVFVQHIPDARFTRISEAKHLSTAKKDVADGLRACYREACTLAGLRDPEGYADRYQAALEHNVRTQVRRHFGIASQTPTTDLKTTRDIETPKPPPPFDALG